MRREFDVCVIGTGAGGGVMIDALTAAGLDVVALQKGPFLQTSDFDDDALRHGVRGTTFGAERIETYRPDEATPTIAGRFNGIAECVGGTTVVSGGLAFRFRPSDFKILSIEGPVDGASLADWPLDYTELDPWYRRAEEAFGVSGRLDANPYQAPREGGLPNPALPGRAASVAIAEGARRLGLHPYPAPMSINSRPYGDRPACLLAGTCAGFGCPVHAKASTLSVSIPRALKTGKLDLRSGAAARQIIVGDDGRARGVRYLDWKGREQEVWARGVVLAAGAIGSPHLLLQSGVANSSGLVGRNLMFHLRPTVAFVRKDPGFGFLGVTSHVAVDDYQGTARGRGFIRGGVVLESNALTAEPVAWALAGSAGRGGLRPWGRALKKHIAEFARGAALTAVLEDLPMESNRVEVDPDVKDRFGLAVPRITHAQHPNDVAMHGWFGERLLEIASAAGAAEKWPVGVPGATTVDEDSGMAGSPFPLGTCRMGREPSRSVVDGWCRSHDVENLWIVDGSVFPTAGGYPPMLTIVALAYRAADRMIGSKGVGAS